MTSNLKGLSQFKKINIAIVIALIVTILIEIFISPYTAFAKECDDISKSVFRLHIVPNSNSQQDQQIKLIIRDKLLSLDNELFSTTLSAQENLGFIKHTISDTLSNYGFTYGVNVEICNMYFATRDYTTFTLPAGSYDAIRITLGEGNGYNWWCVLYPAMCIPAASANQDIETALTDEQQDLIENKDGKYEVKFAVVELFQKIINTIKNDTKQT